MGAQCMKSIRKDQDNKTKKRKKKKYDLEMKATGLPDIDPFFDAAKDPLETLLSVSNKISKPYKQLQSSSKANLLIDPDLECSVLAMLHAFSAGSDGDLSKVGLKIVTSTPYIKVDSYSLRPEHREMAKNWNSFVEGLEEAGPKFSHLSEELERLSEESQELPERAKNSVQNNNLSSMDQEKALLAVGENVKKLSAAPKILEEVRAFQEKILNEIGRLVNERLQDEGLTSQINEIGHAAYTCHIFEPAELILQFWPNKERILNNKKH